MALNQIAAAIAGSPNIIVGKNPPWNVPEGLIDPSANTAGAFRKTLISPCCPPKSPPIFVNHRGVLTTWCNPNGINILLMNPKAPIIPAFPQ